MGWGWLGDGGERWMVGWGGRGILLIHIKIVKKDLDDADCKF